MFKSSFGRRIGACCVVLAALGVAACSSDAKTTEAPVAQTVTVISNDTAKSKVLTDIYARALENSGFRVARRAAVADLDAAYAALQSGAADLYVSSTGELLTYLAANEPAAASTSTTAVPTTTTTIAATTTELATTTTEAATTTEATDDSTGDTTDDTTGDTTGDSTDAGSTTIAAEESTTTTISTAGQASAVSLNLQSNLIGEILPETLQIGAPSNAEDKPVIACKTAVTTGISLLSDLADVSADLRIAGTADFETGDPFGLVGFEKVYDATFGEFVPVEAADIAPAFAPEPEVDTTSTTTAASTDISTETTVAEPVETDADCGAFASSLDPTINTEMLVLDDDKNWIENNGVIPLLTATAYTAGVSQIIDQVSQALTTGDLREMVRQVEDGTAPATIAGQWLQLVGLSG